MEESKIRLKLEEDIQYARVNEQLLKDQGKNQRNLKKLLDENLTYTKNIFEDTQKIRRYMMIRTVINVIWLIIVLTPLVLAFVYLPPVLRDIFGQYKSLLGEGQHALEIFNQLK